MRVLPAVTLFLTLASASWAQKPQDNAAHTDADQAVQGGGALPQGWSARTDGNADLANVRVAPTAGGIHVTLGPAIILYKASTDGKGPFHTLATFTLTKPTKHPEGYGLFAGGRALDGAEQSYVYFLVRQDGTYLIKRRDGETTSDITKGWVSDPAVKKPDASGTSTNMLEIDDKQYESKVVFKVNGKPVYSAEAKTMDLDGIVGLRVNHNLDLQVAGFDVHR